MTFGLLTNSERLNTYKLKISDDNYSLDITKTVKAKNLDDLRRRIMQWFFTKSKHDDLFFVVYNAKTGKKSGTLFLMKRSERRKYPFIRWDTDGKTVYSYDVTPKGELINKRKW